MSRPPKYWEKAKKLLSNKKVIANWPTQLEVSGFELHHGISEYTDPNNIPHLSSKRAI